MMRKEQMQEVKISICSMSSTSSERPIAQQQFIELMSNNYLGQPPQGQPVIIINHNNNMMNDSVNSMPNAKPQPQNALQYLSENTLESNAKLNFIKKVYMILICQLTFTISICLFSYYYKPFFQFQIDYWWVSLIFAVLSIFFALVIECTEIGRKHPYSLIILLLFTGSFSYIISYTTSLYAQRYGGSLVIQAVAITIALVIGLTAYAFITRTDFTTWIGIMVVVLICFIFFGITCAVQWNPILYSLYCTFGAIIAGILLIIDTQMIVGGERAFQISMDDYVLGALILYVDIVRLFLYILRAMGGGRRG